MSPDVTNLDSNLAEGSPPSTPLASGSKIDMPFTPPPVSKLDTHVAVSPPLQTSLSQSSQSSSSSTGSQFLLPIPTPSANMSQSSFAYSDRSRPDSERPFDAVSAEIAAADISIAPDGSFVETSSGPAARELKRRYDQYVRVDKDVRSPYAITAFVNQHGKQMFRVGNRELSAPAAASGDVDSRFSQLPFGESLTLNPPKTKRRSRMSVHTLIPPSLKSAMTTQQSLATTISSQDQPRNKLRKTRSIPDTFNGSVYSSSSTDLPGEQPTPSIITGRAHSHSVTGADLPRLPGTMVDVARPPKGDIFGDVMRWKVGSVVASPFSSVSGSARFGRGHMSPGDSSTSSLSDHNYHPPAIVLYPFGNNVSFDIPSRKPEPDYLPMPHMLREVQSFESGLTARASDIEPRLSLKPESPLPPPLEHDNEDDSAETTPHASFIPVINEPSPDLDQAFEKPVSPGLSPLPETAMHSRYATDVFDVLQTYRGLPLLDRMDDNTVIRMSYRPDDTATPRDDPRFVLWGSMTVIDQDDVSISQGSKTDLSSTHSSHASRRKSARSGKAPSTSAIDLPKFLISPEESTRKVLVAATIERWIAQLTSDLNYDELLNFFLTYRTYISAVDLCHLLICRFHWALGKHSSSHDEMVKRIVRVRTFVAIRYWLLTFFQDDFLPNRELRLSLANWLNALVRDPILKSHTDGLSLVRKLIKVVKDCKEAHTRKGRTSTKQSPNRTSKLRNTVSHVLGDKFAEATYKEEDSDVDLDFVAEEGEITPAVGGFKNDSANAHLSAVHDGTGLSSAPKPTHVPSASAAILQQPLPMNILQQSRVSASSVNAASSAAPFMQSPASLPIHRNTLSRAFVKTIGRLGHWKRVLNSRQTVQPLPGTTPDVSAFDLELNEEGDLLAVRGGVEQYLKMIEHQPPPVHVSAPTPPPAASPSLPPNDGKPSLCLSQNPTVSDARSSTVVGDEPPPNAPPGYADSMTTEPSGSSSRPTTETSDGISFDSQTSASVVSPARAVQRSRARSSSGSSSDSSLGSPIRSKPPGLSAAQPTTGRSAWGFDVVSIDELDLSDTSSDIHGEVPAAPPGLKKLPRKLPLRRDFEFVRQSRESVSSMGITSHQSVTSEPSVASGGEPELGGGGLFQQWQLNAIVDSLSDNEESGDLEATLRRLEGQINPERQQEKLQKVDGWVKSIQKRQAAGDYSNETPRFLDEEEGAEDGEPDLDDDTGSVRWRGYEDAPYPGNSVSQGPSSRTSQESVVYSGPPGVAPAFAHNVALSPSASGPTSPQRSSDAKPLPEDAVPLEILQGRVPSRPSTSNGLPKSSSPSPQSRNIAHPTSRFGAASIPKHHRSWILNCRAQSLVEHFSIIDRELFNGVKFEELVHDDWITCEEVNILDWAQFLKDRARWKAESRWTHKTSALAAVRARFNLLANFTLSEVVLTHPSERLLIVRKFIRIAWKAYCSSSYNVLFAVIAGLQSDWVAKAMRGAWGRLGSWENRVYDDLVKWTDAKEDFKFVRQAVTAMVDAKPINATSHAPSIISAGATDGQSSSKSKTTSDGMSPSPSGCIPFIGIYLSQLYRHHKLPDLIDPTAPNEAVRVDSQSGNFDAPAHPEVFSDLAPLPASMQLEPLINVHKQRLIADVVKMMVAGQHLASRVQYPVDKKLFQKCLKIRGLETEILHRAQTMYE